MSKRSQFQTFLNTGTAISPVWVLLGEGITTGSINYNATTTEEVYIHQDSGTTEIDSYKPSMPVEAKHNEADPAILYLDQMRKTRPVGADAHTQICNVWAYEDAVAGEYPAELQDVTIQFENFGGEGGTKNVLNFTINYRGDRVIGGFDPVSAIFTSDIYFLYA